MKDYQIRVVQEAASLALKIQKLATFLYMSDILTVTAEERALLKEQLVAMVQYNIILDKRINNFNRQEY